MKKNRHLQLNLIRNMLLGALLLGTGAAQAGIAPGSANNYQAVTLYHGVGQLPIDITYMYNTKTKVWYWNWGMNVTRVTSGSYTYLAVRRNDGSLLHFRNPTLSGSINTWVGDGDVYGAIKETLSGSTTTGYAYQRLDGVTENFNASGQLTSIVDLNGNTVTLVYGSNGYPSSITDANGRSVAITYPSGYSAFVLPNNRTMYTYYNSYSEYNKFTFADGKYLSFGYDAATNKLISSLTDENGAVVKNWTYDSNGRPLTYQNAGKSQVTIAYNTDGSNTLTNQDGTVTQLNYAIVQGVAKPVSGTVGGVAFAKTYDNNGNVLTATDGNGHVTTYTYTPDGRNLEASRVLASDTTGTGSDVSHLVTTTWHATLVRPLTITEYAGSTTGAPPARSTTYTYDTHGNRLTQAITAGSVTRTWTYTYNSAGQVLTAQDPLGHTTTYAYGTSGNDQGLLVAVTNALNQTTTFAHNADGWVSSMTDPNGTVTVYTYSPRGWLLTRTVNGDTTTLTYDNAGQLTAVTLPDASSVNYTYDAAHRLTDLSDAVGHHVHYTLDAAGKRTKEESFNADGSEAREVNRTFDALSRLQTEINGATTQAGSTYGYYADGELKSVTTPKGAITSFDIDALGRTTKRTDPVNGSPQPTQLAYNALDQLTAYTAPNGANTAYTVDGFGNPTQESSSDHGTVNATYDVAGNLKTRTDARGVVTTYQYDALNRVITASTSNGSNLSYVWDTSPGCTHGIGHLCQITDASGNTVFDYDANGNRTTKTRTENGQAFVTHYAYNAANRPTDVITPTAETVSVSLDSAGQVQNISATSPANVSTTVASSVSYDAAGNIYTQMLGLSLLNMTFDTAGRLSAQTGTDTTYSSGGSDADAPLPPWVPLLLGAGLLGGMARHARATRGGRVWTLAGGYLACLLTAGLFTMTMPHPAQAADLSLQYDPNGNVSSKASPSGTSTYTYDALDRLNTESGPAGNRTHSFDGNDNRTSDGAGTTATYTPNSDKIATINGIAVTLDAAGNVTGDGTYQYVWDDWGNLKEVHLANGTLLATYYYDDQHLRTRKVTTTAAPQGASTTYYHYDEQGHLLGESASASTPLMTYLWNRDTLTGLIVHQPQRTVYTVQVDQLGSPFQVRTLAGKVVWRWEPEAFGKTLPNEDVDGDGQKLTLNLRFPGQYYDRESGLHYNWQRYYSPKLARYLSPDPIGLAGGNNIFAYVGGNPVSRTDRFGLATSAQVNAAVQTLQGMFPNVLIASPASVTGVPGLSGILGNPLGGKTDLSGNIQYNADLFGADGTPVSEGQLGEFLNTIAHEMQHLNENWIDRIGLNEGEWLRAITGDDSWSIEDDIEHNANIMYELARKKFGDRLKNRCH